MAWQDVILLSILNLVGSMIIKIIVGLLTVKIDDEFFILFDEKPDLLWKMPLVTVLTFAGEYGEIEDYVRRIDENMQKLEYNYVTGNAVTDVIINDKCRRTKKAGIRFCPVRVR